MGRKLQIRIRVFVRTTDQGLCGLRHKHTHRCLEVRRRAFEQASTTPKEQAVSHEQGRSSLESCDTPRGAFVSVPGHAFERGVTAIRDVPTCVCSHIQNRKLDPRHVDTLPDLDRPRESRNALLVVSRAQDRAARRFAQFHVPAHVIGVVMGVHDRVQRDTERLEDGQDRRSIRWIDHKRSGAAADQIDVVVSPDRDLHQFEHESSIRGGPVV